MFQLEGYQSLKDMLRIEVVANKRFNITMTKVHAQSKGRNDFIQGDFNKTIEVFEK